MTAADTPRIVVAGGGVAGLEACLGLRSLRAEDDLTSSCCAATTTSSTARSPSSSRSTARRWSMRARALRRRPRGATRSRLPGGGRPARPRGHHRTRVACPTTPCSSRRRPRRPRAPRAPTFRGAATPPPCARRSTTGRRHDRVRRPLRRLLDAAPLRAGAPLRRRADRAGRRAARSPRDPPEARRSRPSARPRRGAQTSSPPGRGLRRPRPRPLRPTPATSSSPTAGGCRPRRW